MTQYDKMTKTPIGKLIISLSIPTILTMLISTIYNLVDTMFVGKLGTSASGAVGVVFSFMAILQSIGFLFGQGAGSILSRLLGAKDKEGASRAASTGFFSAFGLAVIVAVVSFIFIDGLIMLLGSTITIAPFAKQYLIYILISAPFTVTSFTLNNFLRYEGKAKLGTVGMLTGAVLNMAGDPLFMFYFKMGVAGAGLSTAVAQIVSFIILIFMFISGKTESKISIKYFYPNMKHIGNIVGTGMPSLLRQSLTSLSTIILNTIAGPYGGDAAIAAFGIVAKVSFAVFSVSLGIGQAFQPISAFNFGAKKYSRVREAFKTALLYSEIVMVIIVVIVYIFAADIVQIFRDDLDVIIIGTRTLQLYVMANLALPFCALTEMLLQTTGNKISSSFLSSSRSGIFLIPCIFILAHFRQLQGLEEAQPLAMILALIPAVILCKSFFAKLPLEDND